MEKKSGVLLVILLLLVFFVLAAFDQGPTQIENNITAKCGEDEASACSHWLAYSGLPTGVECYNETGTDGYCKLHKVGAVYGYFTINSSPDGNSNVVPAGQNCYITVNEINLSSSETDETLNITINGVTQTFSDPGGNGAGNGVANVTSANTFSFIGGSVGADSITFKAVGNNATYIDYFFIHDCSASSAVPEFSDFAVLLVLVVVVGGFLILKKRGQ